MSQSTTARRPLIGLTTYRKSGPDSLKSPAVALNPAYTEAIAAAGGIPLLIPLGLDEAALATILSQVDGLVLTGGGDVAGHEYNSAHPELIRNIDEDRDRVELYLARNAMAERKPLLAICRGHQLLNIALGGTLYEDIQELMPASIKHDYFDDNPREFLSHEVNIHEDSRLAQIIGQTEGVKVNSLHHQGVRDLGTGLRATAFAPDGLVEAVEAQDHPFAIGVQWHPESLAPDNPRMLSIFRALVGAAAQESSAA